MVGLVIELGRGAIMTLVGLFAVMTLVGIPAWFYLDRRHRKRAAEERAQTLRNRRREVFDAQLANACDLLLDHLSELEATSTVVGRFSIWEDLRFGEDNTNRGTFDREVITALFKRLAVDHGYEADIFWVHNDGVLTLSKAQQTALVQ